MYDRFLLTWLACSVFIVGCNPSSSVRDQAKAANDPSAEAMVDAPVESGLSIELTPENTSIEFVGNHTGDDPKPRHGRFGRFRGVAVVDSTLKSVSIEIETASLSTDIEKLTNHLKNSDFFDVNRFPTARFQSTAITDRGDGTMEVTGDLTLLDSTNSVTFPATVNADGDLTLRAEFEIDRTRWGMNYGPEQVEKQVPMTITIGG